MRANVISDIFPLHCFQKSGFIQGFQIFIALVLRKAGKLRKLADAIISGGHSVKQDKEAARFGIDEDRAVNYNADREGTAVIYEAVSEAVCNVRACRPMTNDWRCRVDEDYKKRGK